MTTAETIALQMPDTVGTVREYVRSELVRRNLASLVTKQTLQIVDVGGGNGGDAAWLAWLGHQVVVVDPSEARLKLAGQRRKQLPAGIAANLKLWRGTAQQFLAYGARGSYDLAMAHDVSAYTGDPVQFIRTVLRLAKPGGHASLLEPGFGSARARLLHTGDYRGLEWLQGMNGPNGRVPDNPGVWTITPDHFITIASGTRRGSRVGYAGVCITNDLADDRPLTGVSQNELTRIIDREAARGSDPPFRATAPYLHFVVHTAG